MLRRSRAEAEDGPARVAVTLRGGGQVEGATGLPVLDHLLAEVARAARVDLAVSAGAAGGEQLVGAVGRALGEAVAGLLRAPGARGLASQVAPALEALANVVVEAADEGLLVTNVDLTEARLGGLRGDLVGQFLGALAEGARATLHVRLLHGEDTGHVLDAIAKALGLALAEACAPRPDVQESPSEGAPSG
ncbi:MAG: hypothetical protein R3C15_06760 [Thermoleophilia bacterium]